MELSPERQVEILIRAVTESKTPLEFYNVIGPYLPYLTPSILDRHKARMWIKYLKNLARGLSFQDLNPIGVRRALALLEGSYYLLEEEIFQTVLSLEESRELSEIEAIIKALRIYKEELLLLRELSEGAISNPSRIGVLLVKVRRLLKELEKNESPPLKGLPSPQELWSQFMTLAREQWLGASLAREKGFVNAMTDQVAHLRKRMGEVRKKGGKIDLEELEETLEEYFGLVIRYNRSVKEFRRLRRKFPQYRRELEKHKAKLEKIWEELTDLKIRNFLTLLVSGRELPPP